MYRIKHNCVNKVYLTGLDIVVFSTQGDHGWELVGVCCGWIIHPKGFTILQLHSEVGALLVDGTEHLTVADRDWQAQAVFHYKWSFILLEGVCCLFGSLCKCLGNGKNMSTVADYPLLDFLVKWWQQYLTAPRLLSMASPHLERVMLSWSLLLMMMTVL